MPDLPEFPGEGRRLVDGKLQAPNIGDGLIPEIVPLPDLADMVNMSDADLHALLQRYGITEPWPALIAQAQKYNEEFSRVSRYTDPDAFNEQVDRLLGLAQNDKPPERLLGLARRTQETYTTLDALDGDANALLLRICEYDDNSCQDCKDMAGFEGTYAEHEAEGAPGSQRCGLRCRCQRMRIE